MIETHLYGYWTSPAARATQLFQGTRWWGGFPFRMFLLMAGVAVGSATRRGTELGLLVFATLLATLASCSVSLARDGDVPASALLYGGGLAVLYGVAHLAVRRLAPYADPLVPTSE